MWTRENTVQSMTPAHRARTVLAAGAFLPWSAGDDVVTAPYFVRNGAPVLLVDRQVSERLVGIGRISVVLEHLPVLGTVMLSGWVNRATDQECLALARHYRETHLGCDRACRAVGTEVVAVDLDHVRISVPDDRLFVPVDLGDYFSTAPDPIIAEGLAMTEHLNADHQHDLLRLAASMTGTAPHELVAAAIEWIDAHGLDLMVIGRDGGATVRALFCRQLSAITDLAAELHRMVADPGQHFFVEPR